LKIPRKILKNANIDQFQKFFSKFLRIAFDTFYGKKCIQKLKIVLSQNHPNANSQSNLLRNSFLKAIIERKKMASKLDSQHLIEEFVFF
jgi:hypothetical protein